MNLPPHPFPTAGHEGHNRSTHLIHYHLMRKILQACRLETALFVYGTSNLNSSRVHRTVSQGTHGSVGNTLNGPRIHCRGKSSTAVLHPGCINLHERDRLLLLSLRQLQLDIVEVRIVVKTTR
jgi:hypothetical protein